jgi:HAD superfamily hydrolase (TIGR01548 family)
MVRARPELIIFDVDGVLVDVTGSFHRTILETIRHFAGGRPTYAEIHDWKNRGGYNDDWKLTTDWLASLGHPLSYPKVKRQFQKFYWGHPRGNGEGYVARERWLVRRALLQRWSGEYELAIFTGRTRQELRYTLDRWKVARFFRQMITADDVKRKKPDPEGLLRILRDRGPERALYLGDNIDDAEAARQARIPFVGVLPRDMEAWQVRSARLRKLGARAILNSVQEMEHWWR